MNDSLQKNCIVMHDSLRKDKLSQKDDWQLAEEVVDMHNSSQNEELVCKAGCKKKSCCA